MVHFKGAPLSVVGCEVFTTIDLGRWTPAMGDAVLVGNPQALGGGMEEASYVLPQEIGAGRRFVRVRVVALLAAP